MLGSSEAPFVASYPQLAPPQIAMQPIAEQPSIGAQDQTDNDPTSQHAVDKDTDKDSSGLVCDTVWTACRLILCNVDGIFVLQVLPLARIKRIIKSEGDVKAVSSEASFAVARAAVSSSKLTQNALKLAVTSVASAPSLPVKFASSFCVCC